MLPTQPTYDKETNSQDYETTTKEPQGEKENKNFPTEVICGASWYIGYKDNWPNGSHQG